MNKTCILIPLYNEEKWIVATYDAMSRQNLPFVFVNDGSTDRSLAILKDIQSITNDFETLSYPKNRGKGYAIKRGTKYLTEKGYNYILIMDADMQMSINDIPQFLLALKIHPKAKIIIGNRFNGHKIMPLHRLIGNRFSSWLISILAGKRIPDCQCGYRLYHKDVFKLNLKTNGFDFETEVLIKTGRKGYKIVSVPIKCIYQKNRKPKNKLPKLILSLIKLYFNLLRKYNLLK